ncbi:transcription factor bHLH92-like [Cucurbita moschata]|uniref:Transcription factor bHLH92-like n=1 Tax=Cucurbita moschata TaxID=3662 RepID=A0A6J1EQ49_CUCMO|nr:transcription factor bHLH92-like [Cucurbita moschata]
MDDGFPVEFWHTDLHWLDPPIPVSDPAPGQISAFVPYLPQPTIGSRQKNNPITATTIIATYSENVHKRVIEYWRKQWQEKKKPAEMGDLERERSHRHMLNERMRREKHRRSYSELHSMLPSKTKNDKNSIVQMAARTIEELKASEGMLKKRNIELEMALSAKKRKQEKGTTPIRVAVANPSSGINSMLGVLNLLKTVGVNAKAIHATFLDSRFSTHIAIDSHMRAAEVERALQMTLSEAERKLQRQMRGRFP